MVRNYIPIPEDQKKKRGPKSRQISAESIDKVLKLKNLGVTMKRICREVNLSRYLVNKLLKNI